MNKSVTLIEKGSNVKKGTTIIEAEPFVAVLNKQFRKELCDYCFKRYNLLYYRDREQRDVNTKLIDDNLCTQFNVVAVAKFRDVQAVSMFITAAENVKKNRGLSIKRNVQI